MNYLPHTWQYIKHITFKIFSCQHIILKIIHELYYFLFIIRTLESSADLILTEHLISDYLLASAQQIHRTSDYQVGQYRFKSVQTVAKV